MSDFRFTVHGQPPSVNHMYIRVRGRWDKMAKTPKVAEYQHDVGWILRAARPTGWKPPAVGFIRVCYRFHLKRDADCDNLMKVLNDAIANTLGVNDRMFLPCVLEKTTGNRVPYTEIEITALPSPTSAREDSSPSGSPSTLRARSASSPRAR